SGVATIPIRRVAVIACFIAAYAAVAAKVTLRARIRICWITRVTGEATTHINDASRTTIRAASVAVVTFLTRIAYAVAAPRTVLPAGANPARFNRLAVVTATVTADVGPVVAFFCSFNGTVAAACA